RAVARHPGAQGGGPLPHGRVWGCGPQTAPRNAGEGSRNSATVAILPCNAADRFVEIPRYRVRERGRGCGLWLRPCFGSGTRHALRSDDWRYLARATLLLVGCTATQGVSSTFKVGITV